MTNTSNPKVVQIPDEEPIPVEIIAQSIVRIDESMKKIVASGLKRETLVLLLSSHSGVAKAHVRSVLDSMDKLRSAYTTK